MTRNTRFAASLHILAYLAYRAGGAVSSGEIARSVSTNPVVIRRLLSALVKARLVNAHKGVAGGFRLARAPAEISLLEVYHAVEPKPSRGLARFAPNHRCPVGARIERVLEDIFNRAQVQMEAELGRATLAEIDTQLHAVCPGRAKAGSNHLP